jgi:hypothetical protein
MRFMSLMLLVLLGIGAWEFQGEKGASRPRHGRGGELTIADDGTPWPR